VRGATARTQPSTLLQPTRIVTPAPCLQVVSQLHVFSGQPPEELAHCMTFFVLRSVNGKVGAGVGGLARSEHAGRYIRNTWRAARATAFIVGHSKLQVVFATVVWPVSA
jgi:hypothetical protein